MLRPVAWPLCDPTRGRALSEDTPPVRAPWSMTEVVTCVVVERWCGKKKWVEGACSEVDAGKETDGRETVKPSNRTVLPRHAAHQQAKDRRWESDAKGGQPRWC